MGGEIAGRDIALKQVGEEITGRVGGKNLGWSCVLHQVNGYLVGRLGGQFVGHDVNAETEDCPPVLASLLAALTYHYYWFIRPSPPPRSGQ